MMNSVSDKWKRVSSDRPCPICEKPDWCLVAVDGSAAICQRIESPHRSGEAGWLHRLNDGHVGFRDKFESRIATYSQIATDPISPRTSESAQNADSDQRHRVYTALLAAFPLSMSHRAALAARGLTDELISRNCYGSLSRNRRDSVIAMERQFGIATLTRVPGFALSNGIDGSPGLLLRGSCGLLVPVRDLEGRVVALKIRRDDSGKDAGSKYIYLSSKRSGGPSPGSPAHVPLGLAGPCPVVRVVEGGLKADVAWSRTGLPTIAIPGVSLWGRAIKLLNALQATTVVIAFDADAWSNPAVAVQLAAFVNAVFRQGLKVELERWSSDDGKGLDDLLVGGKEPVRVTEAEDVRQAVAQALDQSGANDPMRNRTRVASSDPRVGPSRPTILISVHEDRVNAQAVQALAQDSEIFQRFGMLARVVRDSGPEKHGIQRSEAPRIEPLPPALLRERLAANAEWTQIKTTPNGDLIEVPAHPPGWCVAAVHVWGNWPGLRHLNGVVEHPVLRPDGTLLLAPGYDQQTGLLLESVHGMPDIPEHPALTDALTALDHLVEVVEDFPFERDIHRAAWLAGLLTPLARYAFHGPAPLFLVDANVRGAGKGLLLETISQIVAGEPFTLATYTDDEEELRKRITSLVVGGDRLVMFDNLSGRFGNGTLDAALTATRWCDRMLGVNRTIKAPLQMTWYATGNNVSIHADTARRICHIRLESPEEKPEERHIFRHPNLQRWVAERRPQLLAAALTILRAYCVAGRPDVGLGAWGSYEGWSSLVRSAVVWVGLPDPGLTRQLLQDQADLAAESMNLILDSLERMDPERQGKTAGEIIEQVKIAPDLWADMKEAIESLTGRLDTRVLGNRLRHYRRRIFRGRYIDHAGTRQRAARWAVFPAAEFREKAELTHQTHQTHSAEPETGADASDW